MSKLLMLSLVPLLFLPICLCCSAAQSSQANDHLAQLDREIKKKLPVGSSRQDIINFLENRKIKVEDSRDIKYYKGTQKLWGLVTDPKVHSLVKTEATLTFEFNEKGSLTAYKMTRQRVGP